MQQKYGWPRIYHRIRTRSRHVGQGSGASMVPAIVFQDVNWMLLQNSSKVKQIGRFVSSAGEDEWGDAQ